MPKVREILVARLKRLDCPFNGMSEGKLAEAWVRENLQACEPQGFLPETKPELLAAGLYETERTYTNEWNTGRIRALMDEGPDVWKPIEVGSDGHIYNGLHRSAAAILMGLTTIRGCFYHPGPMNATERWLVGLTDACPSFAMPA